MAKQLAAANKHLHVDADDLANEGMLAYLRLMPRFDPSRGTLEAYVRTRVLGAMRDKIRGRLRLDRYESSAVDVDQQPATMPDAPPEVLRRLEQILSPADLSFVYRSFFQGYTDTEIAEQEGIHKSNVMRRRKAILARLAGDLDLKALYQE